jgi:DNA-binding NarL/FixJ family response regulator
VIVSSTTADEVLVDYEKYAPDIVIIDYKLPGKKNGIQAAKEILIKYPSARVLIITAYESVKDELKKDEFFKAKKAEVLIKPIRLAHLADTIVNI